MSKINPEIETAVSNRDWDRVAALWAQHIEQAPADLIGYLGQGVALREGGYFDQADDALSRALGQFPKDLNLRIELAWVALRKKQFKRAQSLWQEIVDIDPDNPKNYFGLSRSYKEEGDFLHAEQSLTLGMRSFPEDKVLLAEFATLAANQMDWSTALQRWSLYSRIFPLCLKGPLGCAEALRRDKLYEVAEVWIERYLHQLPSRLEFLIEHARVAYDRGDFANAIHRWRKVMDRFPNIDIGYFEIAHALHMCSRTEEGELILLDGIGKISSPERLFFAHAKLAEFRRDWAAAVERWRTFNREYPVAAVGYAGLGRALRMTNQLEEAENVLRHGFENHSDNPDVVAQRAWTSNDRKDWAEALKRWEEAQSRFPMHSEIAEGAGQARWQAQLESRVESDPTGPIIIEPVQVGREENQSVHNLLLKFESLGNNCEFGLVQRRFGGEPLGLLRWAFIPTNILIELLHTRFDGVGDLNYTQLRIADNDEYIVIDVRYGLHLHTYQMKGRVDPNKLLADQCKRISYLKQKLIADLIEAEKLFIVKSVEGLPAKQLFLLHDKFLEYGPCGLLFVSEAKTSYGRGSVQKLRPGLVVANISQLNPFVINGVEHWNIRFDEWSEICRAALSEFETAMLTAETTLTQQTAPQGKRI